MIPPTPKRSVSRPDDDNLLALYRDAARELGTDDLVIMRRPSGLRAFDRARFVSDLPDFRSRMPEPAAFRWKEETARGERGAAFFWLITIRPDRTGTVEAMRLRFVSVH